MAEVRGAQIEFVIHRFTLELYWQLHLAWAPRGNLKQDNSKSETISRCRSLKEFHVDIAFDVLLIFIVSLRESLDLQQMRSHVRRQMVYLVWNLNSICLLNFD